MNDEQLRRATSQEYKRLATETETAGVLDELLYRHDASVTAPGLTVGLVSRTPRLLAAIFAAATVTALVVGAFAISSGDSDLVSLAPGAGTGSTEAPPASGAGSTPQSTSGPPDSTPTTPPDSTPTTPPTSRPPTQVPLTDLVGYDHDLGPVAFSVDGIAQQLFESWVGDPRARVASGSEGELYVEASQAACAPSIVRASSSGVETFLSNAVAPATEADSGLLAVVRTVPTQDCFAPTGVVSVVDRQATEVWSFDINAAGGGIPLVPIAVAFVGTDRLVVLADAVDDSPAAVPGRTLLLEYELAGDTARFVNQIDSDLGELWRSIAPIGASGRVIVGSTIDGQSEVIEIDLATGGRIAAVAVPGVPNSIAFDRSSETWFATLEGSSAADDLLVHESSPRVALAEGIGGVASLP